MVIGQYEARAIAMELAEERFDRPLTHDLLHSVISSLGHRLERIEIVKLEDEVFFAELDLVGEDDIVKVDSRPSDAIALALRSRAPIFVAEEVLEQAGVRPEEIVVEGDDTEQPNPITDAIDPAQVEQVRRLLEDLDLDEGSDQSSTS
jgi:bifunctional DNase/RNase